MSMSGSIRRLAWPWLSWSCLAVFLLTSSACGDDKPPTQPTPTPNPPSPPATVTAGRVSQSPTGPGIVLATTFTFTAEGFAASDNSPLSYTWLFGDGGRETGGASITHTFAGPGTFVVTATASTTAGQSATALLTSVTVLTVNGTWGLQDATGAFLVRNSSLNQNGTSVGGDDTALNCRFAVTGSVAPQRSITLTWTRGRNDCQGSTLPVTFGFTGVVNETAGGFLGTLDSGAPARLVPCSAASCA
jgi:PKD repeat protein